MRGAQVYTWDDAVSFRNTTGIETEAQRLTVDHSHRFEVLNPMANPEKLEDTERPQGRGFLPALMVRSIAFYTITICILISVVASVLAIWDYADQDTLWRTVATCIVVGFGTLIFAIINRVFGR